MIDPAAYATQRVGRSVWSAGYRQCVALARDWCLVNGFPLPSGNTAATLSFPAPWCRLPLSAAQAGDLVEWHSSLPGSYGAGHIALYLARLSVGFRSLDQNWSCACSVNGDCPCACGVAHRDQVNDLPYVAGVWRHVEPEPPGPPADLMPAELISRTMVVSP